MPQLRCTGRLCPGPAFSPASLTLPQTAAEVPRGALGQPPQEEALCQWAQESRPHLQLGHAVSPLSIVHPLTSRLRAPENRALDFLCICPHSLATQTVKNPPARQGGLGSISGSGRSPGGGHGNPLQYSCLENPHGQRSLAGCSPWGRTRLSD